MNLSDEEEELNEFDKDDNVTVIMCERVGKATPGSCGNPRTRSNFVSEHKGGYFRQAVVLT